jgi:hypothetical protein
LVDFVDLWLIFVDLWLWVALGCHGLIGLPWVDWVVVGEWVVNGGGGFVGRQWSWRSGFAFVKRRIGKVRRRKEEKKMGCRGERKKNILMKWRRN